MQQIDNQLTIAAIHARYRDGTSTPQELCAEIKERIAASSDYNAWISVLTDTELKPYLDALSGKSLEELPLYGIPFAIKDNIDLADIPTTAACKEYSYTPSTSAVAVQRLIDAGAIPIGKTNLDQFATGLVGTRSPFGAVKNPYNEDYIAGGSSSGSAVAVSLGHVCFALGTDTAGSGRIPAAFNNLVGLKPSLGRISTQGVVPACQSLDCVSVFGLNNYDVSQVYAVLDDYDPDNSFARADRISKKVFTSPITIGIPEEKDLEFFDDTAYQTCFNTTVDKLKREHINIVTIDFTPFIEVANMLYQGSWVAERYAAIENFIGNHADTLHPITRQIIEPAVHLGAVSCYQDQYKLRALKRQCDAVLAKVDMICIPTAGRHYTLEEIETEPVSYNSNLGYYTNFMNLLDYAAIAIPAGETTADLPFGITLFSTANTDWQLLEQSHLIHTSLMQMQAQPETDAIFDRATADFIDVAVCGAHLSGMPLNVQLTDRDAVLIKQTTTAACYRFYALAGGPPYRPGLILDNETGAAIEVEVWRMPAHHFASFMQGIPHPLGIGTVKLVDGSEVNGFICEGYAIKDATDITDYGGWRAYMASLAD